MGSRAPGARGVGWIAAPLPVITASSPEAATGHRQPGTGDLPSGPPDGTPYQFWRRCRTPYQFWLDIPGK